MAISVERVPRRRERTQTAFRLLTRLAALGAYAAALALAWTLFAPLLQSEGAAGRPSLSPPAPVETTRVRRGETLAVVAARNGVSVARLLALNPKLQPLGLEPGRKLRVG
jgi:hypothetical protein